ITQKDNSPTKVWKFGRNKKKSDLLLPQLTRLSNLHFEIILERNCQFYIRDLSCNGTWVNGIKLPTNMKFRLFDSDVIGLGYGIEEDCINYELEFNNSFMAQHRYLFLKKIKLASQNNPEIRLKKQSEAIKKNSISTRFVNVQQQYRFFPDQLGQGAFATVKKAERLSDKKLFAIKIISKLKLVGTALGGVQSEMEVLTSINHPRIVKLHDFFEDAENFYIVMDLVEGGDLMDFIAENGSIEEEACCEIAFQILQAVKYMHERNITHRDLKPDNILIEQDSPVLIKITDFGLAKKGNAFKTFCGTLAYIAPELLQDIANRNQLRPRYMRPEYTTQVDMWSLGCLVYVIMTGHLPFSASSEEDLFKQIKIGEFHQGPLKMNNISEKGQSFLKALICVDPSKRLNAEEALKHSWFLEGRGSLTEPSQIVACSQKIALSQKANNLQDVNNKNVNRSEIENWKKDPMMDGSSQPWKRQKDPMNPPVIPKGFVPLNENETLDTDLDVTKPVAYYEEDREALIKLYPLENARNTTATKKLLGIDKKTFTIGRNRLADYTISDNTISKLHCMLAKLPDAKNPSTFNWWLYCYSTNPMFVNDIKLTKHMKMKVYIGDAIKFVWN
ncbi:Pkinase-domain-containing protein, partial [Hanseniaspora valbyensis NRRL Y-1626]